MRSLTGLTGFRRSFSRKSITSFNTFSIDKLSNRFYEVLTDIYGDIDSALTKIELMLPLNIFLKNLISFCTSLRIPFTVDELKHFISSSSGRKNYLKFEKFSEIIRNSKEKHPKPEIQKISVNEGTSTNDLSSQLSPVYKLTKEKLKTILSYTLTEKFANFLEAFAFATSQKTITFFGFLKLVKFLNVYVDEKLASEFFYEFSQNGHLTLQRFKSLWFNTEGLCVVSTCENLSEALSTFCEFHTRQFCMKGKKAYKSLTKDLDLKTRVYVKTLIKKNPYPEAKGLKNLLQNYSVKAFSGETWQAMALYISSKGMKFPCYSPMTKLIRSAASNKSLPRSSQSASRPRLQEKKKLKIISYTNDSVVLVAC